MAAKKKTVAKKRPRKQRAGCLSLKARKRLLDTLIDGATSDLPDRDVPDIADRLISHGLRLYENRLQVDHADVIVLTPSHQTTRLLAAINDHMEATDEPGDKIVARLIASLGSSAAFDSQPN